MSRAEGTLRADGMMNGWNVLRRGVLGLAVVSAVAFAAPSWAADPAPKNLDADGLALRGYDPVAYFVDGAPTEGTAEYTASFEGATYRFASAANREAFVAEPARYAPAYGGYCAFGTAMGRKFDGDPEAWAIVDDRLYLNINQSVQRRWETNPDGFITNADHNWTLIEDVADAALAANPPATLRLGAAE